MIDSFKVRRPTGRRLGVRAARPLVLHLPARRAHRISSLGTSDGAHNPLALRQITSFQCLGNMPPSPQHKIPSIHTLRVQLGQIKNIHMLFNILQTSFSNFDKWNPRFIRSHFPKPLAIQIIIRIVHQQF